MPIEYNFDEQTRILGDDIGPINVTVYDSDDPDNRQPVDITTAVIRWHFRQCDAKGPLVKRAEVGDGITVTDGLAGQFTLDEFRALFPEGGTYYHDCEVALADGSVNTPIYGTLTLKEDVTK